MRYLSEEPLNNEEHRLSTLSQTKLLVAGYYIDYFITLIMENSKSIPFYLIAARCEGNGIGKDNDLPWSLKSEMDYFTRMTTTTMDPSKQNALIMGRLVGVRCEVRVLMVTHRRRTWESIPVSERPLPGRTSIVLTSRPKEDISPLDEVLVCRSFDEAVQRVEGLTERIETCWV